MKIIVYKRWFTLTLTGVLALSLLVIILSIFNITAKGDTPKTSNNLTTANLPHHVAAGDTTQTSTVLWARATIVGDVVFEYSTDPTLSTNVMSQAVTVVDVLQPVKVLITGLTPDTAYTYRATDAGDSSSLGQFRTAAPAGVTRGLRFGISGDWESQLAPYPSISNADERNLEFFIEHGDTITAKSSVTAEQFRLEHAAVYSTYYGLNHWANLRSSTSIMATIDDNDVRDNFAGAMPPADDPRFDNTGSYVNETQLYQTALQVFQEYNPISATLYGTTGDPLTAGKTKLYRYRTYGDDAAIFLLDTRSYRVEQLDEPTDPLSAINFLNNSLNMTNRTILGGQQLNDLKADLLQAQLNGVTWKFVVSPSPIQILVFKAEDRWEGYGAKRTELLRYIQDNDIQNVVFVAAGLHGTVVNNLTYHETPTAFSNQIPVDAFEIIVGPVGIDPPSGPFGPIAVDTAEMNGLITAQERQTYDNGTRAEKDAFVQNLIDDKLIKPNGIDVGYDPTGLDGSGFDAVLTQGRYVAAHTYGWTEFDIDPQTQVLTTTVYGIDFYTETLLLNSPNEVINRQPEIVTQFVVTPKSNNVPFDSLALDGPVNGNINTLYTFTATVTPSDATTPVTYTWQASNQSDIINDNGGLSNSASFFWPAAGQKVITVTAHNGESTVTDTHTISITETQGGIVSLTDVTISGPVTGTANISYTFIASINPISATMPVTYTWQASDQLDVIHTSTLTDGITFLWDTPGTKMISTTAENGGGTVSNTYNISIFDIPVDDATIFLPLLIKESQ